MTRFALGVLVLPLILATPSRAQVGTLSGTFTVPPAPPAAGAPAGLPMGPMIFTAPSIIVAPKPAASGGGRTLSDYNIQKE